MGYNLRLHVPGQPREHCSNVLKCWRNIDDCVIYILLPATCQLIAKSFTEGIELKVIDKMFGLNSYRVIIDLNVLSVCLFSPDTGTLITF